MGLVVGRLAVGFRLHQPQPSLLQSLQWLPALPGPP